ncbi:MAG: DUF1552 domain-containing protein [Polyangiaceae bacterium]|nr:DUF1552 domain-containing protein [Polyangiaceae bacterium]
MTKSISRRSFQRWLGLGAAGALLAPLTRRLLAEAEGAAVAAPRFFVFTDGNGWGHQGMSRNAELLNTTIRSPTDWDVPNCLQALAPYRSELSIVRGLYNSHDGSQHGSGWATLSHMPKPAQGGPGGISIDRLVAQTLGAADPFSSIALGLSEFGRLDSPAECASADGEGQPFPAFNTPVRAFANIFGNGVPMADQGGAISLLQRDKSLLDAACAETERLEKTLVGFERQKFQQMVTSCRGLEGRLTSRISTLGTATTPTAPAIALDRTGLDPEVIRGHVDVAIQAFALGMTHVAHLSVFGMDAHNDGWGFLGIPGDAHEDLMHGTKPYTQGHTECVRLIADYKARELAYFWGKLKEIPEGNGTMADSTVLIWVNSGGGKHHDGHDYNPIVILGNAAGKLQAGKFIEYGIYQRSVSDVFLSVAQALGVQAQSFGAPEDSKGPIGELLA